MIDLAGGEATEAAQAAVIELMGDQLKLNGDGKLEGSQASLVQSVLQIAHVAFHRAVVSWVARWAVEGKDAMALQDLIDGVAV